MRQTILYLVILAVVGFAVYYFLIADNGAAYNKSEAGFTVKDTGAVGKVFLVANDGESILLERTDSGWMVNKTCKAMPSTMNMLLGTLYEQSALYPVTQNAYENAIKIMSTDGIKTEVYDRKGKKMTAFYVGGVAVNNTGTNMLMDGAKRPFVVQVAGFAGYLSARYSTRIRDWRDRMIVNLPPQEVKSVSVQYPDKPINSFVLTRADSARIDITGDPNITKYTENYNMRRAGVYMKYFSNINCEGYLNGLSDMDSTIRTSHKHSVLDIEGMHGQHQHMDIYWVAINPRSKNRTVSNPDIPDDYDADRLYAIINNNKDTVMIQQFVFKNIFRRAYEFFQKDVTNEEPTHKPKNVLINKKV